MFFPCRLPPDRWYEQIQELRKTMRSDRRKQRHSCSNEIEVIKDWRFVSNVKGFIIWDYFWHPNDRFKFSGSPSGPFEVTIVRNHHLQALLMKA